MTRRRLIGFVATAPLWLTPLWSGAVGAAEVQTFTPAAFAAAQQAGRSILVHVTAPWCAICKAQKPILSRLEAEPRFAALTVFTIDFDGQKEALRQVGARSQSTLITYKGTQETGRSVGETQPEWIEGVLEKAL